MADAPSYLGEFRINWRYLASATLGVAFGYGINNYLNNIFVPPLMAEFGWERSQVALLGSAALLSLICQPVAGRMADRFGVRIVASFGIAMGVVVYLLLSRMGGNFIHFFALNALQIALVAATTGPVVYSRLIAQTYDKARGVALAIATCSPSIAGVAVVPLMTDFIEREGWRAGYLVAAAVSGVAGALAVALIPADSGRRHLVSEASADPETRLSHVVREPAFRLIIAGVLLCSLTILMQTTQLKVIMQDAGLGSAQAAYIISVYATGVIVGRVMCGAALDRWPAHAVAAISLGLPAFGLAILAAGIPSPLVMGVGVVLLGLSLGAEGDIAGYLTMTYFRVEVYGMVVGIVVGSLSFSGAVGSLILSGVLAVTDSFAPFLIFAALCSLAGAWLFWQLKRIPKVAHE